MAREPAKADFGPEADAAARADAGAPPSTPGLWNGPQPSGDPAPTGGIEVELISDYWPADQPEPETNPARPARENRLRAGERVSLPQEEVMNLLERGIARRVQK